MQASSRQTQPASTSLGRAGLFLSFGKKLLYSGPVRGRCLPGLPEPVLDPRNETEFRAELHARRHRAAAPHRPRWLPVGETSLENPDLTQAIGYLRHLRAWPVAAGDHDQAHHPELADSVHRGRGVGGRPRRPPGRGGTRARGATPYAVADLVFDVWGPGPRCRSPSSPAKR